ncbi:hypothetical protein RHGRI_021174 [Rhododendron griersonianum]|uniref:Uncharacterized protein n=1 Tax=Rhododendron griersonianum TaxID=479676 RepID=A0AAV6JMM6_9ERIC|nr:hypothetical protein RHGRI_021174 [Rhododendron griersonianum]
MDFELRLPTASKEGDDSRFSAATKQQQQWQRWQRWNLVLQLDVDLTSPKPGLEWTLLIFH